MTYVRTLRRDTHPLPGHRAAGRAADPVHPGPRRRQARLGPPATGDRARGTRPSRSTTVAPAAATSRTARTASNRWPTMRSPCSTTPEVDTAHVVGASMGGAISQIIAVKYPERTRSLTLACTAGRNHPWREELLASWRDAALERGIGLDEPGGRPLGDRPAVVPPVAAGVRVARSAGTRSAGARLRRPVRRDPRTRPSNTRS